MSLCRNALMLLLAAGCEGAAPTVTPPALREEPRAARWVRTSAARGPLPWEAPAVVRSDGAGVAELTASVRVRVVRVLAQPGDRVAQGQRLAEVEAPEVLRAIASRAAATARVVPLRAWRDELASQRDAGMVRASELREVQVRLADAESERLRADADLRASGLPPAELAALARTGRASLRAPLAGVLRSVSMVPGRVTSRSTSSGVRPGARVSTSTWLVVTSGIASKVMPRASHAAMSSAAAATASTRPRARNACRTSRSIHCTPVRVGSASTSVPAATPRTTATPPVTESTVTLRARAASPSRT